MQSKLITRFLTGACTLSLTMQMANFPTLAEDTALPEERSTGLELMDETLTNPIDTAIDSSIDSETLENLTFDFNEVVPFAPANTNTGTTMNNPFIKGTGNSNSFRIPALITLSDGTLLAAADARWNATYDGGGLDTIVSRSTDGGKTWEYSFANYLGDNGDVYNGRDSSCFIDPILAEKDGTIYLLVDIYPYGVALNGSGNTWPTLETGFHDNGKLALKRAGEYRYQYYLDGDSIYRLSDNQKVEGYTVDSHFFITNTATSQTSNLFYKNAPFQVMRTSYLYLVKSEDGGKNWSDPQLLNLKHTNERAFLVAPGRGLVTTEGRIILPTYSFNGNNESQKMDFVYSDDDGASWHRSTPGTSGGRNWSSESAPVELEDGTVRFFFRNGHRRLHYVDYKDNRWLQPVNTGIRTNSNCQISSIKYSRKVDGKDVLFVSCPTGRDGMGSDQSGASHRLNGKIFVGLVGEGNQMEWKSEWHMPVTENNNQFMYSCLTEQQDGSLSILYENKENGWGVGPNAYYTMDFKTYDLNQITFDKAPQADFTIEAVAAKTYGDAQFQLATKGGSGEGAVSFVSQNTDVLSIEGNLATVKKAGTVKVTATKAGDEHYQAASAELEITIAKKALTVKADDKENVVQGEAMPALTYTVEGLVNEDTFENPTLTTTAVDTNTVGTFPINVSEGTLSNAESYDVSYQNGQLKIVAKPAPSVPSAPVTPYVPAPSTKPEPKKTEKIVLPKKPTVIIEEEIPFGSVNTSNLLLKNPRKTSTIAVPVVKDKFTLELSSQTVVTLRNEKSEELLVESDILTIGLTDKLLAEISDKSSVSAEKVDVQKLNDKQKEFAKQNPVYQVLFNKGNQAFDVTQKVWVSVPYLLKEGENPTLVVAYVFDENVNAKHIAKSFYDGKTKAVVFEVEDAKLFTVGNLAEKAAFADIEKHWAKENINFMVSRQVLGRENPTEFMPNENATRESFVTLLGKLEQIVPPMSNKCRFSDVDRTSPNVPYIRWAHLNNLVQGVSKTEFAPQARISREQIAVMLTNYAKYLNIPLDTAQKHNYADENMIADYAKESVAAMHNLGILTGKDGNRFDPKAMATNAEVMTILRRFVEVGLRKY